MVIEQTELVSKTKIVGELITNGTLALDTSHLKVITHEGDNWLVGFGSQHDLMVKLDDTGDEEESISVNLDYTKVASLIQYMQEGIDIDIKENGITFKDKNSTVDLTTVMADNDDIEDITAILKEKDEILSDGVEINRAEFYKALKYLRSIQERDDRTDLETGIMFTKDTSYVVGEMFAVRYDYGLSFDLVLDAHTTKILLSLLSNSESETFTIILKDGFSWFLVDDHVYKVDGLADEVSNEYKEIFEHRGTENTITMDKAETLRILNLTKVLTDSTESDVNFKVKNDLGRIFTKSADSDAADGTFEAGNCEDVHFTVSVEDMLSVISKLPQEVGNTLDFDVVIIPEEYKYDEADLLHLKHDLGDCIFSINTDLD